MTSITPSGLNQFQYDKGAVTGNEQASAATVEQLEKQLDVKFTTEQFDVLKNLFMQGKNPVEALQDPAFGALDKVDTKWLNGLGSDDVAADIYSFMALFQKLAQTMRSTAQTQRQSELTAQVTELQNAAEQMEKVAVMKLVAGCVQGGLQIAGGAMQIGFSASSLSKSMQGLKMQSQGEKMINISENAPKSMQNAKVSTFNEGTDMVESGKNLGALGGHHGQIGQAVGQMAGGAGQVAGAGFNFVADKFEKEKAEMDVRAKEHEVARDQANEMMQQMMEVIRDIKDKLGSIQQASIEANRGIARNI